MNQKIYHRNRVTAGLIVSFALLFLMSWMYRYQEELLILKKKTEVVVQEPECEPEGEKEPEVPLVDATKPMVAITFDDGPSRYTMQLLECLETYGARATFFMVGTNVPKYPETIKKMKEIGCELGNHTGHHARLTKLDIPGIQSEIDITNQELQTVLGESATLVRPPYGSVNEVVQQSAGFPLVLWSVDTRDWELKNAELVRDYVLNTAKDGDIILLHDIHETTVQAMLEVIPKLVNRGFQLVTVSEMAGARGVTLENGQKYYCFY